MIKIGKYKFDSREAAKKRIYFLGVKTGEDGNEYPAHNNEIIHLGNIVLEPAVIDEDGEVETEAVLSEDWHVDVLWSGLEADEDGEYSHPYGWAGKAVDIKGDCLHAFFGLNYDNLKL